MTSQPRPVWLTEEQVNLDDVALAYIVRVLRHEAPADAAEAVNAGLHEHPELPLIEAVLRALGYPHTEQA